MLFQWEANFDIAYHSFPGHTGNGGPFTSKTRITVQLVYLLTSSIYAIVSRI